VGVEVDGHAGPHTGVLTADSAGVSFIVAIPGQIGERRDRSIGRGGGQLLR
jgi:hypothetical protein